MQEGQILVLHEVGTARQCPHSGHLRRRTPRLKSPHLKKSFQTFSTFEPRGPWVCP